MSARAAHLTRNDMADAPRDGRLVVVGSDDCGSFEMRWNPKGENPLVQPGLGIWEMPDGSMTWSEYGGFGPDWWQELMQ